MPNIPISSLPLTTTVCSTALVPIVQNGVTCSTYACLLGSGGGGGGNITCIQAGSNVTVSPSCGIGVVTVSSIGGCFGISCIQAGNNVTVSPSCGVGVVTISSTGGGIGGNVTCLVAGDNVIISPSCGVGVVTVSTTGGSCSCCSCIGYVNSIIAGSGIVINPPSGCGDVTICSAAIINSPMQRGNGIFSILGNVNFATLNAACAPISFIGNGNNNFTSTCGYSSFIGNGICNRVCSAYSAVLGGACNIIPENASSSGAFGCGLNACNCDTFYVNNLCVCGNTSMSPFLINSNCQICVGNNGQLVGFTGIGAAGVLCCSISNATSTIRTGTSNTVSGNYSFVLGNCNVSCGNNNFINGLDVNAGNFNNVAVIGLNNFNVPSECTTYVNCLSVRNMNQGNRVGVGANNILVSAPAVVIYENSASLCSVGRPSTNAFACSGCYSASFISGCVFGSFSTSFSINANNFCSVPLVNGDNTYVGGIYNVSQGNANYLGGGSGNCNNGNFGNVILNGNFQIICTNSCYSTIGGGGFANINGSYNTILNSGNTSCILFGPSYIFSGNIANTNSFASRSVVLASQTTTFQPYLYINSGTGVFRNISGNYATNITGCCICSTDSAAYMYSAVGYAGSSFLQPYTSALNSAGSIHNNSFGFIACANGGVQSGRFASAIILSNNSIVQCDFSFIAAARNASFASGQCWNTVLNGAANGTSCVASEVTQGINNRALGTFSTVSGSNNCAFNSFGYVHGNNSCTNSINSFVVGTDNRSFSPYSGIFGCGIAPMINACSFMSNRLVACNIFGASSLCADANGIISPVVSDIRIKCNIQPLDYGIEELKKLNPVSYNWSDLYKESKGLSRKLGFIAQEVEKIVPEAVSNNQEFYLFDDKALIPIITKSIQNISKRIQVLNQGLDLALEKG